MSRSTVAPESLDDPARLRDAVQTVTIGIERCGQGHGSAAYIHVGNGTGDAGGCDVHNPHYDFNDDISAIGISYWVKLARDFLAR